MPRIFRSNDFVISNEVYTISEEELEDEGMPLELIDPEDGEAGFTEERFEELTGERKRALASKSAEESRYQADEILQKAKEDATRIVNQASLQAKLDHDRLLAQTAEELEHIKKEAYEEAFALGQIDGAKSQVEEIIRSIGALEQAVCKLEGEQAGFMAEYEYNLKWLAWEIASKVLGQKIETDGTEMLSLVKTAVASVKNADWIAIEISEKMTGLIDRLTLELRRTGDDRIEVRGISAPEGTCIIDTPDGLIDASVYSQLENLRLYFAKEDE